MVTSILALLSLLFQLNYPVNPPVCFQRTQFLACFRSTQSSGWNIQASGYVRFSTVHWLPLLASILPLLSPLLKEKSICAYYVRHQHLSGDPPKRELMRENKTQTPNKNKIQNPKSRKSKCSWKVWLTGENLPTTSSPAVSGQHVDHWASLALTIVPPALEHGLHKHREANLLRGVFSIDGCWVSRTTLGGWFCHCVLYSQEFYGNGHGSHIAVTRRPFHFLDILYVEVVNIFAYKN